MNDPLHLKVQGVIHWYADLKHEDGYAEAA